MKLKFSKPSGRRVRRFLAELATIVLGVLISIAFAQAVDSLHWASEVRGSRDALRTEIARNAEFFALRVAASDCMDRRLDQLSVILERTARGERQPTVQPFQNWASQGLRDDRWQSERAAQSLTHFGKTEYFRFSLYYGLLRDMQPWIEDEVVLWDRLRLLQGDPGPLGPADIAGLRRDLAGARGRNLLLVRNARRMLEMGAAVGVPAPAADPARLRKVCAPIVQG